MIPDKVFFVKGYGIHKDKLASFELALRDARIEKYNIVNVSSILPPHCKRVEPNEGIKYLNPGQILFCVMAKKQTNKPHKLISAAIGSATPKKGNIHGYLSEYTAFDEEEETSREYAEYLAATMLSTTSENQTNPKQMLEGFNTTSIAQSIECNKKGLWTTALAAAVFIIK